MQTQQNKASPLSNIVKSEATISLCAVKQEDVSSEGTCQLGSPTFDFPVKRPLIDSAGPAMTTPYTKRIKQERDWEPSFSENKEGISSSITSLQSIVNEVVRSFENDNNYENILSSQRTDNSGFNSTNDTPLSVQKDAIVIERKERQLNSSPQFACRCE
ncbi:hypothetical protein OS493_022850 [Desmophyllum pertusum]|uniref:Uncharacterized protein n=1 Tax=Desmophyllum pertusum TaxID=174260 RepID=A0A9W9ZMU7_9CNID|nr:hypothetical protein OS493_022850 [Desmophyllum pertusum]